MLDINDTVISTMVITLFLASWDKVEWGMSFLLKKRMERGSML